jgi:hypothetical protein
MGYEKILRLTLVPAILLLLLSLVSVALTTHYWIIGDWILTKGVKVQTDDFIERTQRYRIDETIVYFVQTVTDATIVSGCLCLVAAIVALVAWVQLRKPGMDSFDAGVCSCCRNFIFPTDELQTTRRFWVLAVIVTTIAGFCSSIAALALHYTKRGNNEFGCTSETLNMLGSSNTNEYCTREMAVCNFLPKYLSAGERDTAVLACNETVSPP